MNLLIFSRPGIRIYQELRRSETAWHALRFYNPLEIPVGIFIQVSSLSAALSLASDLKYFIRKYGAEHLFEISKELYCTAAFATGRYTTREKLPDPWPWKLWYWVVGDGTILKTQTPPGSISQVKTTQGGYLFEVICTEEEFSVHQFVHPNKEQ
ncbi:hypothetical protein KSK55_03500 [Methanospirillum purgamenti]|jgi:hypothetical protein|uniref:Uncharacterized protein n=1 Tax=Methanospirillum hungatei TaxID=2203 RepID=A0A8F5VLW5_METHU|nr:hypothetical protein [Methanospirillum hungatei]QXO95476.1 hypothetical protein KSK55_03500 [Methanospirillum hungatei]